ncbi:AAA family ATPase [Runella sp. SP2]|uniref:AAA family ATPase n=1 Tax=Runella sp. SP2 TaxID=2268026 RepID=UPI000F0984FA|nr:AAA family ATPase [Runella sp. SP2]AYQ31685.1 hypothetical protein DTQ70_05610 [Runella sp. SP2]
MENFRIESLQISQVGPFNALNITFPHKENSEKAEIHILTGPNGTGKSTILECLISRLENAYFLKKHWNSKSDVEINYSYKGKKHSENINGWVENSYPDSFFSEYLHLIRRYFEGVKFEMLYLTYSGYRKIEINRGVSQSIAELQENPFNNSVDFNNSINTQQFLQWVANTITRELIASSKKDKNRADTYRNSISIIENAISEIIGSEIRFILDENPLSVFVVLDNIQLNFDQLPDGLKSMMSWMGDLLMRMDRLKWVNDTPVLERNFILLLDEIEVHLHPAWQRKILPVVQKLFKNAQIFISTHSPFVVGSVDGAWVHRFEKKDGYSVLAGPPILSEDAKSYDYILEEIFGVKERFGVEIERKLQDFQALKASFLAEQRQEDAIRLHQLVKELSGQSTELDSILGMELRQLKRLTNQDFSLTEV